MKVKELIKKLEKLDQDAEVVIQYDEEGYWPASVVTIEKIKNNFREVELVSINWTVENHIIRHD